MVKIKQNHHGKKYIPTCGQVQIFRCCNCRVICVQCCIFNWGIFEPSGLIFSFPTPFVSVFHVAIRVSHWEGDGNVLMCMDLFACSCLCLVDPNNHKHGVSREVLRISWTLHNWDSEWGWNDSIVGVAEPYILWIFLELLRRSVRQLHYS